MARGARWLAGLAVVGCCGVFVASPAGAKPAPSLLRVSADPYVGLPGQHRTEVEPDTFAAGGGFVGAFQVGRVFDGGGVNIGWVASSNGGQRFDSGFLPGLTKVAGGPFDRASDPSAAYDKAHRVWLVSSLGLSDVPHGTAIVINRSGDGRNWSDPVTVAAVRTGQDFDKNWTVCDNHPSSPFYGHCYTEFDDFGDVDRIKMSTSTDGGLTWGAPVETAGRDIGLGGQPLVQPNGTVIVPINDLVHRSVNVFRSTDGGATWSAIQTVAPISRHIVAGGLRTSPLTSAEVDRTGRVYVVWQDCRFRPACSSNDLVLSSSADGLSWSPPDRIPIDPVDSGADHFIPGLAVDSSSAGDKARLALTYYSYPKADCSLATCDLEVGFISSRDGGASWSSPVQLAGPMKLGWIADTSQGRMVGDYISTSFVGGRALPLFAVAGPPTGDLFDEPIATVQGGLNLAPAGERAAQARGHLPAPTAPESATPQRAR
jgi:hypothetical protein